MSDPATFEKITELEGRLAVALERISQALADGATSEPAELEQLKAELAAESKTRRDIAVQLKAIEASRQADRDEAAREAKAAEEKADKLASELTALKATAAKTASDLAAIKAERASEVEELNEILVNLRPIPRGGAA